jgi:hypothetical protein
MNRPTWDAAQPSAAAPSRCFGGVAVFLPRETADRSDQVRRLDGLGWAFHLFVRSCSRRPSQVLVMEPTDARDRLAQPLHSSMLGCVFSDPNPADHHRANSRIT